MQTIQKLPASGDEREALRAKGQFWTPPWLAKVMAAWVTQDRPGVFFDPAACPGTFFAAARETGFTGEFHGFELDSNAFADSWKLGLKVDDFRHVRIADFISTSLPEKFPAIVSNPPYIRHHRLTQEQKLELKQLAQNHFGFSLDGRVGLHIFFLLKCLAQLALGGRLAFLLPADVCEGISSSAFWNRICQQYRLAAAMTFADEAAHFQPWILTQWCSFSPKRSPWKILFGCAFAKKMVKLSLPGWRGGSLQVLSTFIIANWLKP